MFGYQVTAKKKKKGRKTIAYCSIFVRHSTFGPYIDIIIIIVIIAIRTEDGDDVSQSFERSLQSMGAKVSILCWHIHSLTNAYIYCNTQNS